MQIRVNETPQVESKGKWNQITVKYNQDGEDKSWNLVSFTNKEVYDLFLQAQMGEVYEVTSKKDGQYWQWVSATKVDGDVAAPTSSKKTGKTWTPAKADGKNWPDAEERAKVQNYIIKQSCLAQAVNFAQMAVADASIASVIDTAKIFESYVHGTYVAPSYSGTGQGDII